VIDAGHRFTRLIRLISAGTWLPILAFGPRCNGESGRFRQEL
jgi:hypothetical protein